MVGVVHPTLVGYNIHTGERSYGNNLLMIVINTITIMIGKINCDPLAKFNCHPLILTLLGTSVL